MTNSIFTRPEPAPPPPVHVRSDPEPEMTEVPADLVPLPSEGLLYPPSHPLHRRDSIPISPMTTREEDILASRALIKSGRVLPELIKSCLIDKRIDVGTLLSGDRTALMVGIRVSGYGAEYTPRLKCASCGAEDDRPFNLADLQVKRLEIEPTEIGVNEFPFDLPISKQKLTFKFTTAQEEDDIVTAQERMKSKGGFARETLVTSKLLASVVSVNGNRDRAAVNKCVSGMRAGDSLALRRFIEKHEPGVDMKMRTACPACQHEEEVMMPIDITFFWPAARG